MSFFIVYVPLIHCLSAFCMYRKYVVGSCRLVLTNNDVCVVIVRVSQHYGLSAFGQYRRHVRGSCRLVLTVLCLCACVSGLHRLLQLAGCGRQGGGVLEALEGKQHSFITSVLDSEYASAISLLWTALRRKMDRHSENVMIPARMGRGALHRHLCVLL